MQPAFNKFKNVSFVWRVNAVLAFSMSREVERQPMTPTAILVAATDWYHFLQSQ